MANFAISHHFEVHDDYYTPKSAWEQIQNFIPQDYTVWECFSKNSNEQSIRYLKELGFNVIGSKHYDFLTNEGIEHTGLELDLDREGFVKHFEQIVIVSNPPFHKIKSFKKRKDNLKYKCIKKLLDYDLPFIIIINQSNLHQKWMQELLSGRDIKFIFPSKKINFDKYKEGGEEKLETTNNPSMNTVYMTYKILDKNEFI